MRTNLSIVGSDSESGISDAPTAVVSDTEGHGQVIQPRRHVFASPARSSASSKHSATSSRGAAGGRGRGQAVSDSSSSSLSSFTSGSDSDQPANRYSQTCLMQSPFAA